MSKLIIAGGSGFLGNAIANNFKNQFNDIVILTRGISETRNGFRYVSWDGKTIGKWAAELDSCDILINMTGKSVDCRYTEANKKTIHDSRIDATKILGAVISRCQHPPKLWLNSSTATIYRHSLDKQMDETSGEIGTGFSVEVAKAWENAFYSSDSPKTRKVALRTAIVLSNNGGALAPIVNLAKFGFGGKQGDGKQMFSWIHMDDFTKSIEFIIENEFLEGSINISSPEPITNNYLMKCIRQIKKYPFGIPLPKSLLKIGAIIIQTEAELILKSRNVVPKKLQSAGFQFKHKTIQTALENLL